MPCLQINNISCQYHGGQPVLDQLSLTVADNEIVCLLGASGCGKSTLLKAIAGLLPLVAGEIRLGDRLLDGQGASLPPEARNIAMIFQDYALFPHLTVVQNIGFGLAGVSRVERQQTVAAALALVKLQGLAARYPHELSGGQQQRVAIARALVCKPSLMLLDEPFSNIDSQVRLQLIVEIRSLLKGQGIGAIFVSHSKEEAFAFADRLALFRAGHIEQVGQPEQLYRRPQSPFVAEFLGGVNYLAAEVVDSHRVQTSLGMICGTEPHGRHRGERLQLLLRPQQLLLVPEPGGAVTVVAQQFLGHHCRVQLACAGQLLEASTGAPLMAEQVRIEVAPHGLVLFERLGSS